MNAMNWRQCSFARSANGGFGILCRLLNDFCRSIWIFFQKKNCKKKNHFFQSLCRHINRISLFKQRISFQIGSQTIICGDEHLVHISISLLVTSCTFFFGVILRVHKVITLYIWCNSSQFCRKSKRKTNVAWKTAALESSNKATAKCLIEILFVRVLNRNNYKLSVTFWKFD